jgi:hypothetical protein
MRINDRLTSREVDAKGKQGSLLKSGESASSPFVRTLGKRQTELLSYEQELQDLKEEIERAADDLDREPTMARFREFRDLIATLTKKVTSHVYRLEKVGGTTLNPRCYEIVTVIDREADNLYQLIMNQNKDRLAITGKIMELKGLVIDFLT